MDDYLLDTCTISRWLLPSKKDHAVVADFINNLPQNSAKYLSFINLGELRFGEKLGEFRSSSSAILKLQQDLEKAYHLPTLKPTAHTAKYYATIKATLANRRCQKKVKNFSKLRWPEGWVDELTGMALHIDENDIWLASQAAERNLVLVTTDKGLKTLGDTMPENVRVKYLS